MKDGEPGAPFRPRHDSSTLGAILGNAWRELSPETRSHLATVYAHLTGTAAAAALASSAAARGALPLHSMVPVVVLLGATLLLVFTRRRSSGLVRPAALYAAGAAQGWLAAPIVRSALRVDPSALPLAAGGAAIIFGSFTAAALSARRRTYLYLGGVLGAAALILALSSLANGLFIGSHALQSAELYGGLLLFSLYVVFDTQVVVERAEHAQAHGQASDAVADALLLFGDLFAVFVRLLAVLLRQREPDRKRKRR